MFVSATNIVQSLLGFGFQREGEKPVVSLSQDDHAYLRGDVANRGPCPGLNALANQGYL